VFRRHLLSLSIVLLIGCGQSDKPQAQVAQKPGDMARAEVRLGDADDEAPHLPFKIVKIIPNQKLIDESPFHSDGGEWTFFDCKPLKDASVVFTVGVMTKGAAGGALSSWGRALLVVKNQKTGTRLLALFAKAFNGTIPAPVQRPYVPIPLVVHTAVLGENLSRERMGGFNAKQGGWTATKWFPQLDGLEAEVFFNYNLARRVGEFSEKDAEYANDLVAIFGTTLRDGPRPERTPENDPNLTRSGPSIGPPRKLLSRLASYYSFSPAGRFAVYQNKGTILALPLDQPKGKPVEIVRFDNSPWAVHLLNDDLDLLVQEGVAENPNVKSSADPMRVWWVDQKKKEKKLLRGPEKDLNLVEVPVSPDLRFVALDQWRDKPDGKRRTVLIFLERETGKSKDVELPSKTLSLIGWKETDAGLRGLAVTNRWGFDKAEKSETYLVDPVSGNLERQDDADPRAKVSIRTSPDGEYQAGIADGELVVTEVATGTSRRFVFHEEDRRFVEPECVEWVSPRYLKFSGQRLALIDVTTMKMCFPVSADGAKFGSPSYKFSPDFRWVLYQGEDTNGEGLYLAPVEMPVSQK
jgi:hypothetical protein